jgi:hypothetical protein
MNTIIIPILPVDTHIMAIAEECLSRVRFFSHDYKLVTIINGGIPDGASLRNLADDGAYFPDRLGFAAAVNVGLEMIDDNSDWVTIGSCDVYVKEHWQHYLEKDGALVSGLDMSKPAGRDLGYRGNFWAAWWTMPRAVVDKVGLFDTNFNLRLAAQDYAIRAAEAGYQVGRASIYFDHVAAKHSSVGEGFNREMRSEEQRFRQKYGGAYNYHSWNQRRKTAR